MTNKRIYADYAATTPTDRRVIKAMAPFWDKVSSNPSGLHKESLKARAALLEARSKVASIIHAAKDEVIFTSGGTESDNLAIRGVFKAALSRGVKKPSIVTTAFEHSAVLETCRELENEGFSVVYVKPEKNGIINPLKIIQALTPRTVLVSVMYANNEIGTIQPIKEISRLIKKYRLERKKNDYPLFHTDAAQAGNYLPLLSDSLGVDLMTLSGSKIYGPKGSGVLLVKRRARTLVKPILCGGSQEYGLRPGTESVALAAGFAEALSISQNTREIESKRLIELRDLILSRVLTNSRIKLNGDSEKRLPNNINISISGLDNEYAVIMLDKLGIACATRSACKTNDRRGSHVILSLGNSEREALESIRISLGRYTTKSDAIYIAESILKIAT